jgi:helix-turn-helix protein
MDFLTEREAAALLHLSPATLSRWRWIGDGPPFKKFGRSVRYARADLEAFAAAASRRSTSTPPTKAAV